MSALEHPVLSERCANNLRHNNCQNRLPKTAAGQRLHTDRTYPSVVLLTSDCSPKPETIMIRRFTVKLTVPHLENSSDVVASYQNIPPISLEISRERISRVPCWLPCRYSDTPYYYPAENKARDARDKRRILNCKKLFHKSSQNRSTMRGSGISLKLKHGWHK